MTAPSPASPSSHPILGTGDLESLVLPLLDTAYGTALHLTRDPGDAEDLVQESVRLACRGFAAYPRGANFRVWFFRILVTRFSSRYRKPDRQRQMELDDTGELFLFAQTATLGLHRGSDPAKVFLDRMDGEQVRAALQALPDEYRVVATLYFTQDFSYREIADTLEIPVGTVRSRLHRARRMLQKALWTIAQERGIISTFTSPASHEA